MPRFRVHTVTADTPAQAAAIVRKNNPGVIIRKVKRDKSDNVSVRGAKTHWKKAPLPLIVDKSELLDVRYTECDYREKDLRIHNPLARRAPPASW